MNSFHWDTLYYGAFRISFSSEETDLHTAEVLKLYPMKNSKLTLLGMGTALVLSFTNPAVASERNWGEWMQNYYKAPQPDQVVTAVYSLSQEGYFEGVGQPATAIGFLSTVFAQNPDRVGAWMRDFRNLPAAHRRLAAAALWYSGVPSGERELRDLARAADPALRAEVEALLAQGPVPVVKTPVLSESSLNLQWGAFLASGEQQHIVNALAALGSAETGLSAAARTSLAQKAAGHSRVYEICQAELSRQPAGVRDQMRTALAGVKQP
jgi:hypothetical protein